MANSLSNPATPVNFRRFAMYKAVSSVEARNDYSLVVKFSDNEIKGLISPHIWISESSGS